MQRGVVVIALAASACSDPDEMPVRAAECVVQDAKLQAVVDRDWMAPNVMLTVRNAACGNTVYTNEFGGEEAKESLWRIGSVTKTFVSAAILSLAKDGVLSLEDSLERFVPGLANTGGVTIRMLLAHTSGIYNYTEDPAVYMHRDEVWAPRRLVEVATAHPPDFAAGTDYRYSNTNFILLGMILEAATGELAADVLRARAIAPAGLEHTYLDGPETFSEPLIVGYNTRYLDVSYSWHPSSIWTAGMMVASPADVADWVAALYGSDAVLDADQRASLTAGATQTLSFAYGLGVVERYYLNGGRSLGHDGFIDGYHTWALYFPESDTAVVTAANRDDASAESIASAALRALFP